MYMPNKTIMDESASTLLKVKEEKEKETRLDRKILKALESKNAAKLEQILCEDMKYVKHYRIIKMLDYDDCSAIVLVNNCWCSYNEAIRI